MKQLKRLSFMSSFLIAILLFVSCSDDSSTSPNDDTPQNMILVKGGSFQMGNTHNTENDDEQPVHEVKLNDFYLGTVEISIKEFVSFLNEIEIGEDCLYNENLLVNLNSLTSSSIAYQDSQFVFNKCLESKSENCSVVEISWYGALEYCNWRSETEGYEPCYKIDGSKIEYFPNNNGYRLPTEAEWEYAAKGGQSGIADDYIFSGCNTAEELLDYAWFTTNSFDLGENSVDYGVHPGAEKLPNQLGLYDMTGNVYEWCWDWYGEEYYLNSPTENPLGPETGEYRLIRGAAWDGWADYDCYVAYRGNASPEDTEYYLGFRIAKNK